MHVQPPLQASQSLSCVMRHEGSELSVVRHVADTGFRQKNVDR